MKRSYDFVGFVDRFIKRNELNQPFKLSDHQREILRLAFQFDLSGRLSYDTILYSCPKKSGKTAINAAVVLWWAFFQEAPNEILVIANDLEQSLARVFKTAGQIIENNPDLRASATITAKQIVIDNGTVITALASDYRGSAGSNHGLSSWDELWGYGSESSQRLYEELCPVPTRKNSIRFITTYAGFESESTLLRSLYLQSVGKEEHIDGQGECVHPTLPVYVNKAARIFCYWDHEGRMSWQTPEYRQSQKKTLRPSAYVRLHENRWTTGSDIFITAELWDSCVDLTLTPLVIRSSWPLYVAVDAGIKHDYGAVVAVCWENDKLRLACHRIWKPTPEDPLDIETTIEAYLKELCRFHHVAKIVSDPYQMHRTITELKKSSLPVEEYPQTVSNQTRAGQALFDVLKGKNIRIYSDPELREQALSTVAIESTRGFRLAKEKVSKKIDSIVALSMGITIALEAGPWHFTMPEAAGERVITDQSWAEVSLSGGLLD